MGHHGAPAENDFRVFVRGADNKRPADGGTKHEDGRPDKLREGHTLLRVNEDG